MLAEVAGVDGHALGNEGRHDEQRRIQRLLLYRALAQHFESLLLLYEERFEKSFRLPECVRSTGTMGPSTHTHGGARMGTDLETNVVDRKDRHSPMRPGLSYVIN